MYILLEDIKTIGIYGDKTTIILKNGGVITAPETDKSYIMRIALTIQEEVGDEVVEAVKISLNLL